MEAFALLPLINFYIIKTVVHPIVLKEAVTPSQAQNTLSKRDSLVAFKTLIPNPHHHPQLHPPNLHSRRIPTHYHQVHQL